MQQASSHAAAVQFTNIESATAKQSAVSLGYWSDPYVALFVKKPSRKPSIINKGYYARVKAMHGLVKQFLQLTAQSSSRQIVSLGAGFDTLHWLLHDWQLNNRLIYYEVDFEEVCMNKCTIIAKNAVLRDKLHNAQNDGCSIKSDGYHLVAADLKNIASLTTILSGRGLRTDLPTLFITECVLVYVPPESVVEIISWSSTFTNAVFIDYEPARFDDAFGATMLKNLEDRNCALLSAPTYPTIQSQAQRFMDHGWQTAQVLNMNEVFDSHLDAEDQRRINRLEPFDEHEEWRLIMTHYAISWAINDRGNIGLSLLNL